MHKFKVGDEIEGISPGSSVYNITREGWTGVVLKILPETDEGPAARPYDMVVGDYSDLLYNCDGGFSVHSQFFKLRNELKKRPKFKDSPYA